MTAVVTSCNAAEPNVKYVQPGKPYYDYVIGDGSVPFSDSGKFSWYLNKSTWADMNSVYPSEPVANSTTTTMCELLMSMKTKELLKVEVSVQVIASPCTSSWRHLVSKL